MVVERAIPGGVNGEFVERQTSRPIFEKEGTRLVYRHPEFSYYPDDNDRFILRGENKIHLTRRENSIFKGFVENVNEVISHATIGVSDGLFRYYVVRLKKKTQPLPEDPQIIYPIGEKRYLLNDQSRLEDGKPFNGFIYRDKRHSVEARDNHEVFLTIREKKALDFLIKHFGEAVGKDAIAEALYEEKEEGATPLLLRFRVGKLIQELRKKIGDSEQKDGTFRFIVSVHGKGYKLTDPTISS